MKKQILIILVAWLFTIDDGHAQDSLKTASFKVSGVCGQCKKRIELAATKKGVENAVWNESTGILTVTFNPAMQTIEKIQNRILAVGHDVENKKAKNIIYQQLPECCHYRELNSMNDITMHETMQAGIVKDRSPENISDEVVKGVVLEDHVSGRFTPLANASVYWLGSTIGTVTDSNGVFALKYQPDKFRLVVSFTGFRPDTITVTDKHALKIVLAANGQLNEITVTSRQRSTYISGIEPFRTQVMTGGELLKAACCNLSESFETNPSVDVAYNDAVTGSKQIQLLGLSGNYTQLTVENLPGPRGLATPLGLNSIAGPWIESIQLTKGVGSVANGYESIAGQINVELKKPETAEQLLANAYVNDFGKTDINLSFAKKISKHWATALLLHDDFLANKQLDNNHDGFKDLPTGNLFSMVNRYKFDNNKGILAQFGIKALVDNWVGGQTDYNPDTDKNTTNHYGLGMNTERYELFAKAGYIFPRQKYKSIGLQFAAVDYRQNAYFGFTGYDAKQKSIYANLIYQSIIHTTEHKFRTGLSFSYDNYDENFKNRIYHRTESVPGAFFEYTFTPINQFSVVAGVRADYNNLFGAFITPRLNIKYEPVMGTVIRISAGRGQRTANIFAENAGIFVSARQMVIVASDGGKAYGLLPEIAWNKGISIDQKMKLFKREATLSVDFFRNDFSNQVITDLENAREVKFYNLKGQSYSNSFQAELAVIPVKRLDVKIAYRYFDVQATYGGELLERPLMAAHRAFISIDYTTPNAWKLNYTVTYNGRKRLPNTQANPLQYQLPAYSPGYVLMNAQVTKSFGKAYPMDAYIGSENITGFFQQNAIVAASQPFSQYFDASMIWGPVTGRMLYIGWRLKMK